MDILTSEEKKEIKASVRQQCPDKDEEWWRTAEVIQGAFGIIKKTLGIKWGNRFAIPLVSPQGRGFLNRSMSDQGESLNYQNTLSYLAEFINSLWEVSGFQEKLAEFKNTPLKEVYFEMNVAYMVILANHGLKFNPPSGVKGENYDLLAILNGNTVCIEVKCRIKEGPFSKQQLWEPLRDAAHQVPETQPSMVMFGIPKAWTQDRNFVKQVETIMAEFFQRYDWVNAVSVIWEEWQGWAAVTKFWMYKNPQPRIPIEGIQEIIVKQELAEVVANLPGVTYI